MDSYKISTTRKVVANAMLVMCLLLVTGGIIIDLLYGHLVGKGLVILSILIFIGIIFWDVQETTKLRR